MPAPGGCGTCLDVLLMKAFFSHLFIKMNKLNRMTNIRGMQIQMSWLMCIWLLSWLCIHDFDKHLQILQYHSGKDFQKSKTDVSPLTLTMMPQSNLWHVTKSLVVKHVWCKSKYCNFSYGHNSVSSGCESTGHSCHRLLWWPGLLRGQGDSAFVRSRSPRQREWEELHWTLLLEA